MRFSSPLDREFSHLSSGINYLTDRCQNPKIHIKRNLILTSILTILFTPLEPSFYHTWGEFHEPHRNLRLILVLTMYHSLTVLAMDFVSYDGLSIVSQDTINRSTYYVSQPYGSCDGFRKLRWVIHRKPRYD
jgi:hypothetical protein